MKKVFYSLLLFAVALMTTTAFLSCGSDDDEDAPKAASFDFSFIISEDLQKLTDVTVTTGFPQLSFTNKTTIMHGSKTYPAYESQKVKLTGKDADNANFTITFKLKPNWEEILGDQPGVRFYYDYKYTHTKSTGETKVSDHKPDGLDFKTDSEMARKLIESYINGKLHFTYPID